MSWRRVLLGLAFGAVVGWTVFALMAARVTTVERIGDTASQERFQRVRERFEDPSPRLRVGQEGQLSWRPAPAQPVESVETLHVMVYRGPLDGLVQVDVPVWFLRLKEPALRYLLRRTGVDPARWDLSSEQLERQGPAVIVDERRSNGDHLLIWTEGQRTPSESGR